MELSWTLIKNEEDIEGFMNMYGYFHDSCIKEIHYKSGTFVRKDLSMTMINEPVVRVLFQRQWENPSVIEVEFGDLVKLHLKPVDKEYTTDIFKATFKKKGDVFFWADREYWEENNPEDNNFATWISAKSVRWRKRNDLIGGELFYINNDDLQ